VYKWIWPCWFPVKVVAPAWPRSSSTYPHHDTSISTRPKRQRRKGLFSWRTNTVVATAATFSTLSTPSQSIYLLQCRPRRRPIFHQHEYKHLRCNPRMGIKLPPRRDPMWRDLQRRRRFLFEWRSRRRSADVHS